MLSSISPLGERARNSRWWLTVSAYLLGSVVGGGALGALGGLLGSLLPGSWRSSPVAALVLAALVLLGLLADRRFGGSRLPTVRRQVDEAWLGRYRGWVYGFGFGVQLGLGIVTIVTSATVYAVLALTVLSGSPVVGVLLGSVFGLVRGLPILALVGVHTRAALHQVFRRLERWAVPADRCAQASLLALACALTFVAVVGG